MFTFADIFCGCGGFSHGFFNQGAFRGILAVDAWKAAADVYTQNLPGVPFVCADLHDKRQVQALIKRLKGECDVLLGGPPCQGFSTLGKRRVDDQRSTLIDTFAEIAVSVLPRIIIVENVRGIMSLKDSTGQTFAEKLINRLEAGKRSVRYHVKSFLLNALDFGIAQNRVRWVLIAVRGDAPDANATLSTIEQTVSQSRVPVVQTVREAIGDLPTIEASEGHDYCVHRGQPLFNHKAMNHGTALVERFRHVPPGGGLLDVPPKLLTSHLRRMLAGAYGSGGHVKNIYGRLEWEKPCGTIVAGMDKITCGRFVHPSSHRLLTPRECARIQSFPDEFKFKGGLVTQYYLVGNAVPPRLSAILAEAVADALSSRPSSRKRSKLRM